MNEPRPSLDEVKIQEITLYYREATRGG